MGKFIVSDQAEADLKDVFEQSTIRFGSYQADAYLMGYSEHSA